MPVNSHALLCKVGICNLSDLGVFQSFCTVYIAQVKGPIFKKYGKYETNHGMNIPVHMIHGSLKDALNMVRGSKMFRYLADQCLYDVEEFFIQKEGAE